MSKITPPTAQCRRTAFNELECSLPFGDAPSRAKALIADWKDNIPTRCRTFDAESKAWRFWGGFEEVASTLLIEYFPDADMPRRGRTHAAPTASQTGSPFAVLHLLPSAPPQLVDAAYRCLAKLTHPDVGGDPAVMRQLTEAHETLPRRLSV